MNVKRYLLIFIVIWLTFLFTPITYPATKDEIESLRGLTGVEVVIEDLQGKTESELPFDENQIKVDVEQKLRMAGIKVFPWAESLKTRGAPCLYVNSSINKISNLPIFFLNIDIYLIQRVHLERNPNVSLMCKTWVTSLIGTVPKEHLSEMRDRIKDLSDVFIKDYLSVNPKGAK